MATRTRSRLRRIVATAGVAGTLAIAGGGVAQAAQGGTLVPNQSTTYATYFFGKTQVCFKNVGSQDGSVYWESSTSRDSRSLTPGAEYCMARSFAAFRIYVKNTSARSNVAVRFPIGP